MSPEMSSTGGSAEKPDSENIPKEMPETQRSSLLHTYEMLALGLSVNQREEVRNWVEDFREHGTNFLESMVRKIESQEGFGRFVGMAGVLADTPEFSERASEIRNFLTSLAENPQGLEERQVAEILTLLEEGFFGE